MYDSAPEPLDAVAAAERRHLSGVRLDAVRDVLRRRDASAALLQTRANFGWLTVGGSNHVVLSSQNGVAGLLVTTRDVRVLTAVNEAARIEDEEIAGLGIELESLPWHAESAMSDAARRIAGAEPLDDAALEDAIRPRRSVLSAVELERMAWLGSRANAAARHALAGAGRGSSEQHVAAATMQALAVDGIRAPVLLVAADERIARYRHPLPTGAQIRRRVMLVIVAERWGIHVAMTRFAELEPPDDELRRRTEAAQRVLEAMAASTRAGATLGDVLAAARVAYATEGYPEEWELHHQGGSIGYQGRERIATPRDPTPILPGMAFAWNPSITGTKAEETIALADDGLRSLTG